MPPNLYDKVMVPKVGREEQRSDAMLEADAVGEILEYLSTYHFASRRHAILALLWETGIRVGAAYSIDLDDVSIEDGYADLVYRPGCGTTLKNGKSGERPVAITRL